jgi:hypothetical protein
MYAFVYCEWIDERRLSKALPAAQFVTQGVLDGYRLSFVAWTEAQTGATGTGGCHLVEDAGAQVPGLVYEFDATTVAEAERLSRVAAGRYAPLSVVIRGSDSRAYECTAWVIAEPGTPTEADSTYIENMRFGAEAWGLPAPYLSQLDKLRDRTQGSSA